MQKPESAIAAITIRTASILAKGSNMIASPAFSRNEVPSPPHPTNMMEKNKGWLLQQSLQGILPGKSSSCASCRTDSCLVYHQDSNSTQSYRSDSLLESKSATGMTGRIPATRKEIVYYITFDYCYYPFKGPLQPRFLALWSAILISNSALLLLLTAASPAKHDLIHAISFFSI